MKNIFLTLLMLVTTNLISQTLYKYDYVETFDTDWSGIWWTPAATTNYYTNAFVSSTSSAVIYGIGNGTSAYESDWYSFPNLVVDAAYDYQFKFRLGSYRFTSTSGTRGVDAADYITVQLSTNGGTSYVNELRITGASNAFWNYNSTAYTKTANGTLTTIGPSAGGDRTSTGDGYSVIQLNIPAGTTQIAIDIFARANSAGEEWWMDNFELTRIGGPLPVKLSYFDGVTYPKFNLINWTTESEQNSSHFDLESSVDGENWKKITTKIAAENSTEDIEYSHIDYNLNPLTYYRLQQFDIDGKYETFGPIVITRDVKNKQIIGYINLLGQKVDPKYTTGVIIEVYEDGTMIKKIR
jgi:hypothetical protein